MFSADYLKKKGKEEKLVRGIQILLTSPFRVKYAFWMAVFFWLLVSLAAGQEPDSAETDSIPPLLFDWDESESEQADSIPPLFFDEEQSESEQADSIPSLFSDEEQSESEQTDSIPSLFSDEEKSDSAQTDSIPTPSVSGRKSGSEPTDSLPTLLILEPVDLATGKTSEPMGETLREIFNKSAKWNVFNRTTTAEKLLEYDIEISKPCKEFSCAFDAGNMFHSDYVVFSTISLLDKLYAFNLAIIDIKGSKIAWVHTGDIPIKTGRDPDDALLFRLESLIGKLSTKDFRKESVTSKGVMGIVDFSKSTQYSNLIVERITTHMVASGHFEVMGRSELEYLKSAMEVDSNGAGFSSDSVHQVGGKLGLNYLIYSKLNKQHDNYLLRLALYDVTDKQMIRDWPVSSKDFRKVLEFESKFCASLIKTKADFRKYAWLPILKKWNMTASSIAAATGLVFTYAAIRKHKKANDAFDRYQSARTVQELENRSKLKAEVKRLDRRRNLYIGLSGLLFCGSVVVWKF